MKKVSDCPGHQSHLITEELALIIHLRIQGTIVNPGSLGKIAISKKNFTV